MNIKEQQTKDLLREFGVHFSKTKLGFRIPPYWPDCQEPHMEYAVRFERLKPREGEKDVFTILWYASLKEPNKCTAYDVLTSIFKETFSDFEECAVHLGLDHSKKSYRLYKAIQREAQDVIAFFSRENELNLISNLDD